MRRAWVAVLAVAFLTGTSVGVAWAAFTGTTSNSGNAFSAAPAFLHHFEFDAIPDRHSGNAFALTIRAKSSSGATVTSFNGSVALSVSGGSISPTTSNSFTNGVLTQNVTITGPYATNQTVTATHAASGKSGTSAPFTLHDWRYYFAKTTGQTGTGCGPATTLRDMLEGHAGSDPEQTFSRTGGGATHLRFCSPGFAAGDTLGAGTTTVEAYAGNAAGSGCGITATLYKNSGGVTTSLGSTSLTVPAQSPLTARTWSFPSTATTFAANDRLNVSLNLAEVKACASTDVHFGGTANRSYVQLPGP